MNNFKQQNLPYCSVVILNYSGEKVIKECMDALLAMNYPKSKYEIIVVDNNSKDKSKEILIQDYQSYKNIKLIFLEKNFGFSKGNNIGIKHAKGKYVALLNNDCVVYKDWLRQLVLVAEKDNKIFAVNSKILLYPKFINIRFSVDQRLIPVYSWLSRSNLYDENDSKLYNLPLWRTTNFYQIEVPYDPIQDSKAEFTILLNSRGFKFEDITELKDAITFEEKLLDLIDIQINDDDVEFKLRLNLSLKTIQKKSLDKIQNAGIMVFQDGYGRDIGAIVYSGRQSHEYDLKQYNKEREIYAACGAAVLYNRSLLEKIGYLNESFFMYYEDVEVCERARFAGFKTLYTPKAVVRHHHALFSKEWSPFFIYHVEKGRLLHLYYNFPFNVFLTAYCIMIVDSLLTLFLILFKFRDFIYKLKSKKNETGEPILIRRIQTIRALLYFITNAPYLLFKRLSNQNKKATEQNYLKILRGDWYLS